MIPKQSFFALAETTGKSKGILKRKVLSDLTNHRVTQISDPLKLKMVFYLFPLSILVH